MSRVIAWFSCGDCSAVATALTLKENPTAIVARIIIPDEISDSDRYTADCERWLSIEILRLQDPQKRSTMDVFRKERYIQGILGAPCTGELKKAVRYAFQQPDDIHVMGYAAGEETRAIDFKRENFELKTDFPLIRHGLTKDDCHAIIRAEGIEQHLMYRQGFANANCPCCVKGGMGYFNRMRIFYPEKFAALAALGKELNWRPFRYQGKRIRLDELPPGAGRHKEPGFDCSAFCVPALGRIRGH